MSFRFWGFLLLLSSAFAHAQTTFPSPGSSYISRDLEKLALKYIGQDVFTKPFTEVVETLIKDSGTRIDTSIAHADTSKFYLRAYRNDFNPFNVALDSVKAIFAEIVRRERETGRVTDTLFYLQTVGIVNSEVQVKNLKAAFDKMDKEIRSDFNHYKYDKTKNKNKISGESLSYYRLGYPNAPISIAWKKLTPETGVIAITFLVELMKYPSDRM
jgi:hypothetical protein